MSAGATFPRMARSDQSMPQNALSSTIPSEQQVSVKETTQTRTYSDPNGIQAASFVFPASNNDVEGQCPDTGYPDGGLRAWLVVAGSWFCMFACFGVMNTGGVYQAYLSTHQLGPYSESTIGWIFSIYIFLSFACGILIGPFFDAKGPFLLVASGSVCLVLGIFTLAESTQLWHFS